MKLITFEGIEGVGKSTQINFVLEWLKSKDYSVKLLREPGSTDFGEKVRELLLSKIKKNHSIFVNEICIPLVSLPPQ